MAWLQDAVARKKRNLSTRLNAPLAELADRCREVWTDPAGLDETLAKGRMHLPGPYRVYTLDAAGRQLSANVGETGMDPAFRGQELAGRPYLTGALPFQGFLLSPAYLDRVTGPPCITALQAVRHRDRLLGFLAADFFLHELSLEEPEPEGDRGWRQFKGDPAIRENLFRQQRIVSRLDERMDDTLLLLEALLTRHGIFQTTIHFSSSRATLWTVDDPFTYRIHDVEEITDPEVCLAYPRRLYPEQAQVPADRIAPVFQRFRALREADETLYLRSASLNLINATASLTFSCDGSHYMGVEEFLTRDLEWWFGRSRSA
ncbi:MAG TPA: PDC sensor domain-containing protein [Gammaproteobacteria bacterium]|nr:PDC sensor domain-containing protein [Gammaproteobacteria bacterium]